MPYISPRKEVCVVGADRRELRLFIKENSGGCWRHDLQRAKSEASICVGLRFIYLAFFFSIGCQANGRHYQNQVIFPGIIGNPTVNFSPQRLTLILSTASRPLVFTHAEISEAQVSSTDVEWALEFTILPSFQGAAETAVSGTPLKRIIAAETPSFGSSFPSVPLFPHKENRFIFSLMTNGQHFLQWIFINLTS